MEELIGIGGAAGAGFVLVLVGVIRQTIGTRIITDRFTPALAIAVGIGVNVAIKLDAVPTASTTWTGTILLGLLAGLSAMGLWSGGKHLAERVNDRESLE